uniref:Protein TIME FOR COFFEE isoform X3 n=1 Tax=Elaeis guineensis var. tenera TaxID=51953 RepID=A0A6I9RAM6_ELAGV|nr:protein TIME FOR COFFEE isoform X3 [Elaeis guineensis]
MERNREARRGTGAAMNGGLSRRRQRSSSLRDSPEEDGGMEMAEITRLRDRGSKKHRDRDRSSRSKRRRGERILHGSNKDDEGDDSSDESVDEEEDDEEDDVSVAVRLPPPLPPPNPTSSSSPLSQSNHQHHHHQQNRKSLPIKVTRTPPVWKADEMIGFSVPRKARSASTKRSHECWVSGGSGSGEQIPRQASTSPSRLSPASTTQISPSSSNASARKKMMSGSKHRPLKVSKSPSSVQEDIEIEVAEVLYGMTKQFQCAPKQETSKIDSRDTNGGSGNEAKSRISSPNSISPAPPASLPSSVLPPSNLISNPTSLPTDGPKRKKPRPLKLEEERPSSPGGLLAQEASNMEVEHQMKEEASSPRSEKNTACPSTANGGGSNDLSVPPVAAAPLDVQQESSKIGNNPVPDSKLSKGEPDGQNQIENQEEPTPPEKETPLAASDVNHSEETLAKAALSSDVRREEKFCIDLMAPPLGKLSPERDSLCDFDADHKSQGLGIETALKVDIEKKEEKAVEKTAKVDEMVLENKKVDNSMQEEFDLKKQKVKETTLDLQIDLEKPDKDSHSNSNSKLQLQKSPKFEPKQEKAAPSPSPSPPAMPMTIAGWPGSLPPFGYMGQVPSLPAVVPMDGTTGVSNSLQPPSFLSPQPRPKRCVTHGYIAQNIYYHQRISRMNPFWPAAAGAAPLYGAKPCNLSVLPSSDGKNTASSQDNKGAPVVAAFKGPPSKERTPAANNPPTEAAEKKQLVLQQMPQSGSTSNMLHGPTFIFPLNQQQAAAAAAAAVAAATTRSGASKSTPGTGNGALSSGASSSAMVSTGTGCGSAATMNLSFAGLPPNEPQYLAILQNNAYPFPIPAHVAGPPPFRGANPAQAMPFFNGPFFSSQMLHPSQLQQQQQQQLLGPQQPPHTQQQGHQHASTSSGSSSSQKHPQPLQAPGGGASGAGGSNHGLPAANQQQHLLPHQARRREGDKPLEDSPSSTDGRNCQAQKNVYAHNFAMPIHPQNFTLMSAAATAAALGGGGGHGDKMHMQQQQPQQNQSMKVELTSSQAFAMPFISFNGVAAAPGLDFSSMAQNHAIFQALPEASRHGYSQFATAAVAAAATAEAAQQKKTHPEDGKSSGGGDSISANTVGEEERRVITGSKAPGISLQHSFSFSKPDGGPPFSSMLGSGVMDSSSRTLGLIPAPANRSSGPASTTTSIAEVPVVNIPNSQQQQQQQQQFLQLQKHQQQQMQAQLASMKSSGSSNSATVCSERLPAVSTVTKFPQALAGFPQAFIQGGNSSQSPQWKASITRAATTPAPPQAPAQPVAKNNPPAQQQGRAPQQQSFPAQSHQTQISFCMNTTKAVPAGGTSNPPSSSASAIAIGSPPNSVSKSANGNPRASASVKLGSSAAPLSLPQQSSTKSCVSSSGQKSSPASNNRNVPSSILGHPHIAPPNSSTKPQQQQAQQSQKQQQPFPQAQFLFSNPYLQAQPPHSNAGGYHQRRLSELPPSQQAQQQQLNSTPGSSGMLPLGTSALTTDPAKAVAAAAAAAAAAANGMKGMPPPGFLHPAHLAAAAQSAASGAPHPLMPASFPYLSLPAVSLKPAADQKPAAAGNDNSLACWQPEKR